MRVVFEIVGYDEDVTAARECLHAVAKTPAGKRSRVKIKTFYADDGEPDSAELEEAKAERDAAVARADKAEADLLEIRRDADCTRLWMLGAESKREIVAREIDHLREWKGVAVDEIAGLRNANDDLQTALLSHRKEWRALAASCGMGEASPSAEIAARAGEMDGEIDRLKIAAMKKDAEIASILGWAISEVEGCAMFNGAEDVAKRAAELIRRQKLTVDAVRRDLEEIVGKRPGGEEIADVVERVKMKAGDKDRLASQFALIVGSATRAINHGLLLLGDKGESFLPDAINRAIDNENATRAILLRLLGRSESGAATPVLAGNVGLVIDGLRRRIDKAHASMDEAASEVGEACEILATLTGGGLSESAAVLAEKAAVLVAGLRAQHKRAREEVRHLDRLYDGVLDRDLRARRILAPLLSGSENVPLVSLAEAVAAKVAEMKAAKPAVVWVTDQACGPFRWVSAPPKPSEDDEAKTCGECKRFVASTLGDGTRGTCSSVWSDTLASKDACGDFVAKDGAQHPKTCGGCRRYNSTGPNTGTFARFGHHVHGTGNACGHPVAKWGE